MYPLDPPLTDDGVRQAQETGERLQRQGPEGRWNVVISSPFQRCVQTALEICVVTGAGLLIDQSWGEVHSAQVAEVYGKGERRYVRPYDDLVQMVAKRGVALRNPQKPCGHPVPQETTQDARVRYARKFLKYLERALLSSTSFIVVSHGEAFPGCCPLFPQLRAMDVTRASYCAFVLGNLTIGAQEKASSIDDMDEPRTPVPEHALAVLSSLSIVDKTVEVSPRVRDGKKPYLPAWVRSKLPDLRSRETLIETLGLGSSDLAEPRAEGFIASMHVHMNLVELPTPVLEVTRTASSREHHWNVGASTILLGDSFDSDHSLELAREDAKSFKKDNSPRGSKAHQWSSKPQFGTARHENGAPEAQSLTDCSAILKPAAPLSFHSKEWVPREFDGMNDCDNCKDCDVETQSPPSPASSRSNRTTEKLVVPGSGKTPDFLLEKKSRIMISRLWSGGSKKVRPECSPIVEAEVGSDSASEGLRHVDAHRVDHDSDSATYVSVDSKRSQRPAVDLGGMKTNRLFMRRSSQKKD
jgi:broad specificity phosphatase PhoE